MRRMTEGAARRRALFAAMTAAGSAMDITSSYHVASIAKGAWFRAGDAAENGIPKGVHSLWRQRLSHFDAAHARAAPQQMFAVGDKDEAAFGVEVFSVERGVHGEFREPTPSREVFEGGQYLAAYSSAPEVGANINRSQLRVFGNDRPKTGDHSVDFGDQSQFRLRQDHLGHAPHIVGIG